MKAKFLALAALVLGLASCQTDTVNGVKVDANGEAPVTIQVGLPEETTRANSALGAIDNGIDMSQYDIRFILAVYDENNQLAKGPMVEHGDDKAASFSFRLVPGRDYKFVAWADFVRNDSDADLHYNTTAFPVVSLNGNQDLNDESRDAYTQVVTVEDFAGTKSIPNMVLKRPFAKLRVITTDMDQLYSQLEKTTVNYTSKIYTSFDALNSKVHGEPENLGAKEVTYGVEYADNVYGAPEDGEMTLFADYLFGAKDNKVYFTMNVTDKTGIEIPQIVFNTNIPVERNHLTTIYGPVLTDANSVTVTIDEKFEQPGNDVEWKEASTAQELQEAINNASSEKETHIVLTGNINLNDLLNTRAEGAATLVIEKDEVVDIDLGGFTLSATDTTHTNYELIKNAGTLTVKNGKMTVTAENNDGWNRYSAVIANVVGGNLTVDGVEIEHFGGTDMAYGIDNLTNGKGTYAVTTIKNSTITSPYRAVRQFLNGEEATNELYVKAGTKLNGVNKSIFFHDPSAKANTGKLVVEEGAELNGDVYLFVTAGSTEWPVEVSIAASALEGESKVTSGNVPAGYDIVVKDGRYVVEYGVEVNGNDIAVRNAGGFKWIAQQVNSGADYFAGKTVVLTADIDLNNEEWTPIGSAYADHGFMGNFDGNGYTIKNLTIKNITPDTDGYVYAGLFGVTEGADKDNQNYIKNLVIENVAIDLNGHIVAAAIAYPYYTKIEDVTVKGNISIKGGDYTSGVLAYTRRCVDAKNISIIGNEGSVIEGGQTVGGVISDIQTNGGLTANYSNFSAIGLTIKATKAVGGISGIISGQTLDRATVKNVHIDCDADSKGIVAGSLGKSSEIKNVVVEKVTGATRVIGATYGSGAIVVDNANDLVEALEAGKDVFLSNDIKIDPANMSNAYGKTGINVKNGQTIDGGGHTLNIKGAGGTWDSGINTTGGVIKNITVTGSFRGIFINHNSDHSEKVVLENVTITGTTYTISCDQGLYQGIEATNCTFNGWTSFAKTAGEAKFVSCSFGEGSGYKYCRPYSNTEFVGCTFCPGYAVDQTQATVTFTNCTWE